MKTPAGRRTNKYSVALFGMVVITALVALPSVQSRRLTRTSIDNPGKLKPEVDKNQLARSSSHWSWMPNVALPVLGETVELFAADCVNPKTAFNVGETVCAKTNGVDVTTNPGNYYMNWIDSQLNQTNGGTITQNPQYFLFVPPTADTWKATIGQVTPPDSSIVGNPPIFTVSTGPAMSTYAADCATPKTLFTLGDTVCVKVQGVDPSFNRRISWVDPAGNIRQLTAVTSDPQTDSFTLPTAATELIDNALVDNRGTWKVNLISSRGTVLLGTPFNVQDQQPYADLSIGKSAHQSTVDNGSNVTFNISIYNYGPNPAENVVLTDPAPPATSVTNATFVSVTQISGPSFSCTGSSPVVCTRGTNPNPLFLNPGEAAVFEIVYTASGSSGAQIINTAKVSSDTTELEASDNTASADPVTIGAGGGNPPDCMLECPNNITTAQNTTGGANVNFAAPETFGSCGTVAYDHASGSFFPTGTTTVTATSSTGGGSCSFTVTVIEAAAPTITCPANQTVQAPSGQSEATVNVGTPTATGTGVVITSQRSDERPVNDTYPIGTTYITWTATDQYDRQANCVQTIVVTSQDAPTISCPSNKTFTSSNGCTYTATAAEIGTPTTTGPNVTVTSERSDGLALTDPYPAGNTFIEWTATNSVGSASCTQTITVIGNDTEAPTLHVPPSITTSTDQCSVLLDEEQFVATAEDNCSSSVNISRTGIPQVACPTPGNPNRTCDSFVFPTGTTVITYTATDSAGNSTSGTQTVRVNENPNINPTIDAPQNLTVYTGPGATTCGAFVGDATLGTATASDNCPGFVVTRTGVPAGNNFPVGTTTITYTVTDRVGNTAQDTQTVTVIDNTPPVVTPPGPVTLYTGAGATSCNVTVNDLDGTLGTGSATDNCPGVGAVSRSGVPAGNVFPVGQTTLTYSATDAHGNTGTAQQVVTVVDNTPPVISCPANIVLEPTCPSGAIATFAAATATDNCGVQSVVRTAGPASGSVFPIGTTTVTYTATDIHNNTSSCSFTVTVKTVLQTIDDLRASVAGNQQLSGPQRNGLLSKLDAAKQHIQNNNQNGACAKLSDFVNSVQGFISHGDVSAATGNAWISTANHIRNAIGCTNNPCT
ncbi:MAG TPA: HYR domain-containing protein [Pyrinomonadaceae bacterium]|nr:HYR domain-containing protein [Pyrinomonadaceae bacterium]